MTSRCSLTSKIKWREEAIGALLQDLHASSTVDPEREKQRAVERLARIFAVKGPRSLARNLHKSKGILLNNINIQVASPKGFTWEECKYGDLFTAVRGDSLLDLAIRNKSSDKFKEKLRALGGVAKNIKTVDFWEQELEWRKKELESFEGTLIFLPPKEVDMFLRAKERQVDAAGKKAAKEALAAALQISSRPSVATTTGALMKANIDSKPVQIPSPSPPSWQKLHFSFVPEENLMDGFIPLLASADAGCEPMYSFSPLHALIVEEKGDLNMGNIKKEDDVTFSVRCPLGWYAFECSIVPITNDGDVTDQQSESIAPKPICMAAPSRDEMIGWQRAINYNKRGVASATSAPKTALWVNEELGKLRWKLIKSTVLSSKSKSGVGGKRSSNSSC